MLEAMRELHPSQGFETVSGNTKLSYYEQLKHFFSLKDPRLDPESQKHLKKTEFYNLWNSQYSNWVVSSSNLMGTSLLA